MRNTVIRRAEPKDFSDAERVARDAFWDIYKPGADEHLLLRRARSITDEFIPRLEYVAEVDGDIVGQIMYAKTKIIHNDAHEIPAVSFGPVSILPDFQGSGIGSQLITTTLSLVRQEFPDIRYVIIMGDDAYYRRFGFLPAVAYGLTDEDGVMSEHLLVCDLHGGEPEDVGGKIVFGKTYNEIKEEEKAK